MNFKEARRFTAHNGHTHIHSEAYFKLNEFIDAHRRLERLNAEMSAMIKRRQEMIEAYESATDQMLDALTEHYDGRLREALQCSYGVLLIDAEDGKVRMIEAASQCDLYRIEPPQADPEAAAAAPATASSSVE